MTNRYTESVRVAASFSQRDYGVSAAIKRDGLAERGTAGAVRPSRKPALLILGTRGIPAAHGGFETLAERLALHMVDRGWDVTVYCQAEVTAESGLDRAIVVDTWRGVRRVSIPVAGSGPRSTMTFDLRAARHAQGLDGIRLLLGYNTACFLPILNRRGQPVVTNMDGIEWQRDKWPLPAKAWFLLNERIARRLSTELIADHPEIRAHLATRSTVDKMTMIPYGADPIESAPISPLSWYGLEPGRFVVTIARIEPENSVLEMVRAYSRRKRPYAMVCIGTLNPEQNRYHARIRDAASDQVVFPGAIYEKATIASIRRHALAYLHGHTVGGTNPSLVEALGAGSAVVAHANKFNQWTAGPDQFYFGNEDECDDILCKLADDGEALQRARAAATRRHRTAFMWDSVLEAYEALCSRLSKTRARAALLALATAAALVRPAPARAEYLLGPGDRLDITLTGSPPRHVSVNPDGQVDLPQVGLVPLDGLSLPAAQARLRDVYRDKGISLNADVVLEVIESRPFYILGDVSKPGSYPYQPNLTVRKAAALAGGLDMVRFRFGENPFLRAPEIRNESETIAIEWLGLKLRKLRVAAELEGKSDANFASVDRGSVNQDAFLQLVESEREQLKQHLASHEAEIASLEGQITEARAQLQALRAQMETEGAGAQQEERQAAITRTNLEHGVVSQVRMADQLRASSNAQSHYLNTLAQVSISEQSVSELQRQLIQLQGARRASLLREQEDTRAALQEAESKAKAAAEKFSVVAGSRGALYLRPSDQADVAIYRMDNGKEAGTTHQVPATMDTELRPDDEVEINLRPQRLLGAAAAP